MESGVDTKKSIRSIKWWEKEKCLGSRKCGTREKNWVSKEGASVGGKTFDRWTIPFFVVLAARGKVGKRLKRVFNLWPEAVYMMDDKNVCLFCSLSAIDSGDGKFHSF